MLKNAMTNWYSRSRVPRIQAPIHWWPLGTHQKLVRDHMKTRDRLLVVHGTGSGKTLTSAHVAKDYFNQDPYNHIVIFVTPKAVQSQFRNQVATVLSQRPGIYFATYDNLVHFFKELYVSRRETFRNIVKNALIVADEAHYLTKEIKKTRVFFEIFNKADKVLLMTGTPIQNGEMKDLLPYARILNPDKTITAQDLNNPSKFDEYFKCKVSVYRVPNNSNKFPRLLPTERFNFPLTNQQVTRVNENRFKKYAKKSWAFNRSLYSWRIFGNNIEPKFLKFLEIYKQRPHKTIVFFKEYVTLDKFARFLDSQKPKISYRRVTGKEKNKGNIVKLNSAKSNVVYLLTSAAKEGLDFKGVRTVIFMDYPWVPSDYNQIVGRARRFESHIALNSANRNVKVYQLAYTHPTKTTLNMRSLNLLRNKRAMIGMLMDRLVALSIERKRCVAPRRVSTSPNIRNRRIMRSNRILAPGNKYAIDPSTGIKYHLEALNIPFNQPLKPRPSQNENFGMGSMFRQRTRKTPAPATKPKIRGSPVKGNLGLRRMFGEIRPYTKRKATTPNDNRSAKRKK